MINKAEFKVYENGPVEVTGSFEIFNAKGERISTSGPVFLCRCGGSSNKPFCDGTHKKTGFSG
jgi:CDGSH-type Zn-finger protein